MTTNALLIPPAPKATPDLHVVRSYNVPDQEFALRLRSAAQADPQVTRRLADLDVVVTSLPGR